MKLDREKYRTDDITFEIIARLAFIGFDTNRRTVICMFRDEASENRFVALIAFHEANEGRGEKRIWTEKLHVLCGEP